MQFIHELACPPTPDCAKQREIIILKQEDRDASFFVQHPHLSYDFGGLARAHDSSRRGAIERVDRTKGTRAGAPAAGEDRHDASSQHSFRLVVAFRIWQLIEVFD